jgi:hypothetical protein
MWVLNQKKNFNPVFSLKTNFSLKTSKDLDYKDLSSVLEILYVLNSLETEFKLDPKVKLVLPLEIGDKTFDVLGRELRSSNTSISIFEYRNSKTATQKIMELPPFYKSRVFQFKNLIIEGDPTASQFLTLKDSLNAK